MWRPWGADNHIYSEENQAENSEATTSGNQHMHTRLHLSEDAKLIVKKVFSVVSARCHPTPLKETAELTGVPKTTVHKIVNTPDNVGLSRKRKNISQVAVKISDPEKDFLRNIIYSFYEKRQVPTRDAILSELTKAEFPFSFSKTTLGIVLKQIGFKYQQINKRAKILKSPRLQIWRIEYIDKIRQFRREGRPIYYLDETWYDTHDVLRKGWTDNTDKSCMNTPVSRGKRIIILHAGNENGWVPNCLLLSCKNIANCSADYHADMNHVLFEKWFQEQLLPNISPNSVIILDNASYHSRQINKKPNKSSKKGDMIEFMEKNSIEVPHEKVTKKSLLEVIDSRVKDIPNVGKYMVDHLAEQNGHVVLRLPPYYCVLNPIELIWSQLKHGVRKNNVQPELSASVVEEVRRQVNNITAELWSSCVQHCIKVENCYQNEEPPSELIIHLNDDSETDSDSELSS